MLTDDYEQWSFGSSYTCASICCYRNQFCHCYFLVNDLLLELIKDTCSSHTLLHWWCQWNSCLCIQTSRARKLPVELCLSWVLSWRGKTHSFSTACNELILRLLRHIIQQLLLVWKDIFIFIGMSLMTHLSLDFWGRIPRSASSCFICLFSAKFDLFQQCNTHQDTIHLLLPPFSRILQTAVEDYSEDVSSPPTTWRLFSGYFGHFRVSCSAASHYPVAQSNSAWHLKLKNLSLTSISKTHDPILSKSAFLSLPLPNPPELRLNYSCPCISLTSFTQPQGFFPSNFSPLSTEAELFYLLLSVPHVWKTRNL